MAHAERPNSRLLALGTATVIAVYAAGYIRTRPAAAKLAEESAARRRPPARDDRAAPPAITAPVVKPLVDSSTKVASATSKTTKPKSDKQKLIDDPESAKAESLALAQLREDSIARSRPTEFVVPPLNYVPAKKVPTAADSATAAYGPWKDGTYYGWGTSRHGDIKAGIEVVDGKIKRAFISECWTRYSCSWVAHLPRQVVDRQSPEVDSVTSATESANAFYYGIWEALKQAK